MVASSDVNQTQLHLCYLIHLACFGMHCQIFSSRFLSITTCDLLSLSLTHLLMLFYDGCEVRSKPSKLNPFLYACFFFGGSVWGGV